MKRIQAFKFELMPSGEQERVCAASLISRRFVYNEAPDLRIKRHKRGEKNLSYAGLYKELTGWRNASTTHWLADSPIHTLQQGMKDLERAFVNFFEKPADFPTFKKKGAATASAFPIQSRWKLREHSRDSL